MSTDDRCVSNCKYKRLYEGSQTSLTDMSARQATALNRVGRLRSGLISSIRKSFPKESAQIEQQIGKRLTDADDEVLLVLLDSLIKTNNGKDTQIIMQSLAVALFDLDLIPTPDTPEKNWVNYLVSSKNKCKCKHITESKTKESANEVQNKIEKDTKELKDYNKTPLSELFKTDIDLGWSDSSSNMNNNSTEKERKEPTPLIELWPDVLGATDDLDMWSPSPIININHKENTDTPKLFEGLVKPEITSKKPKERKRGVSKKTPRVQAEPASIKYDELALDKVTEQISSDTSNALYAASSIPRPVFTRDLINIVGDRSIVQKWEEECRQYPERYGVRFIAPKARHKERGSLVIVEETSKIKTKKQSVMWWPEVIQKYSGTRLYEIAVLLQRVSDELVSYKLDDTHAVLRLATPKGLVTLLVTMTDRTEKGEEGYTRIQESYKEIINERITLIAVLTTIGEESDLSRTVSSLLVMIEETGLKPACPVIAARSWEYADNRGTTAKVII